MNIDAKNDFSLLLHPSNPPPIHAAPKWVEFLHRDPLDTEFKNKIIIYGFKNAITFWEISATVAIRPEPSYPQASKPLSGPMNSTPLDLRV